VRIALCTQDGVTYQADNFNQTEHFETKKRFIVCPQCNGQAFYRGPTRNGRDACFGARPHTDECTLRATEHECAANCQVGPEEEVFTTGQRIMLDFNFGTQDVALDGQQAGVMAANGNAGTPGGTGAGVRETMTRRMSSLLRALIETEEFRRSTQIIEVTRQGEFTVANFFVNFAEVTDAHNDGYHGFWGMVADAEIDRSGTLWFNSGGREDLSVRLDHRYIKEAYHRFHIGDEEDIAGAYILALGMLKKAQGRGKRHVGIAAPGCFTLRLA
jgi:hypothetical protein